MVVHISSMRIFPPDPAVYPLFTNAVYADVDLEPGDLLYIPRRWWHWVTSYDRSIALSMWHADDRASLNVPLDAADVSRVDVVGDSSDFAPRYFTAKEPVVVRSGHVKSWPAFTRWTDDYLSAKVGGKEHYVGISPDAHLQGIKTDENRTRAQVMTMDEFLEKSRSSPDYYQFPQDDVIPGLLQADWQIPEFWRACFRDDSFRTALWFTFGRDERGVTSGLHFDYYENLLAVVSGRKRVRLFSQAQSKYLYQANEEMIPVAPRVSA